MTNPTADQIERLPKWAQTHIERLERDLARAREAIEERDGEVGWTDTYMRTLESMKDGTPGRPLPKGEQIRFVLNPADREAYIDVRVHHDARGPGGAGQASVVEVRGGRSVVVLPGSANAFKVRTMTWHEYAAGTVLSSEETP